ncbi:MULTISPECIES: YdcF family protein [unclassified Burkholderia]|uniref:YdcF family protein n=1 Tax=unclassified Burkholderia TaxID=2613784 RepID=UPI000755A8F0|nr:MULTISPECIES: YdcF family protein [unclassified Burkholderia]KVN17603.1 hypothetical protein WT08_03020 [Burkholderia sp. MSMB1552]KWZ55657.1 hypothetical protein WS92_06825 [Burkholderia sp. MSMB1588]
MILFNSFGLLFVVFLLCRKRRAAFAILAAGAALLWLIASGWLAAPLVALAEAGVRPVAHPVMTGDTTIVMLGAGIRRRDGAAVPPRDALARIDKTAELYSACQRTAKRCTVVVSGGDPQMRGITEADTYAPYLLARGVAHADLIRERSSHTTYENARFTVPILRAQHYDDLILVTSSYQMKRALLDFERFGIVPQPVYANRRDARLGWLPRAANLVNAELALHEIVGVAQFHVYRRLGWF